MFYWGRILGGNPDKCSNEFAFLPFTVTSTDVYFFKLTQPLTYFFKLTQPLTYFYSSVIVHYKRKPRQTWEKPHPLSYGLRNPYRILKSEISPDYAQKPQRNCTFMNLASYFYSGSGWPELERPSSIRTDSTGCPTTHRLRGRQQGQETFVFQKDLLLCCIVFNLTLKSFFKI